MIYIFPAYFAMHLESFDHQLWVELFSGGVKRPSLPLWVYLRDEDLVGQNIALLNQSFGSKKFSVQTNLLLKCPGLKYK